MLTCLHACRDVSEQAHKNLTPVMATGKGNSVVKRFSREKI